MIEILKKAFDKFDTLIILAAIFLFLHFALIDKIYIASFAFWTATKAIRVYIIYKNERKG